MTKLVRNIIIGSSATVTAAGASTGIAIAVTHKKDSNSKNELSAQHLAKIAHQKMMESKGPALAEMQAEELAAKAREEQIALYGREHAALERDSYIEKQAQTEMAQALYVESQGIIQQGIEREASMAHWAEMKGRDAANTVFQKELADLMDTSETRVLIYRERVKAEVEQYAKTEFDKYMTRAWREANPEAARLFRGFEDMNELAQKWWLLLQTETVSRIKVLEARMIELIADQFHVTITPYQG